jgi:hypothetical protein
VAARRIGGVVFRARAPGIWLDDGEAYVLLYLGEYRLWELSTNRPDEDGPLPHELLVRAFTLREIQEQSPDLTRRA